MPEKKYELAQIAVDPVIFTIHESKLKVLLHLREKEPQKGKYELPGGFVLPQETAEHTIKRKLQQVVGYDNIYFTQFYTFTSPDRDPRGRAVAIGFIALICFDKVKDPHLWHDCSKLPELAFDHQEMIDKAMIYLKDNIGSVIAKEFMPQLFSLNKLQETYEIIERRRQDNRNFRKKMIASGIVEETKIIEKEVSHRPAKLYRFVRNGVGEVRSFASEHIRNAVHFK